MDGYLKQSTAVTVLIGPFVDSGDGNTEEGALTISQADVLLSKNGGALAQKNEASSCIVDASSGMMYTCDLDTTDTNTLGILKLVVHESGSLPVIHSWMVLSANIYDSLIAGSDLLQTDVTQIGGDAQSATDLKDFADAGYDPATDKVTGVKTVDTTTTNTDMVSQANITAILADTNELQTDWVNGGRLDLLIDTIKAITDTLVLADIADAVLDEIVDANAPANANSLRETVNVIASALAGKLSGGGTASRIFRDLGDTKNRITVTVDANYNRTATTPDGT